MNNDLTPVWDIEELLPAIYSYMDRCLEEGKPQEYIDALCDVYEFIDRSFKCIDDNCTPCDTDVASYSPACEILPELEGCNIPFNDVLRGRSERTIYPDIAGWHEKCMKVLYVRDKEVKE